MGLIEGPRVEADSERDLGSSGLKKGPGSCKCHRGSRVECGLGEEPSSCGCQKWTSGRVDSERDLAVADVRERPRAKYGLGEGHDSCGCQRGTSGQVWTQDRTGGFLLRPAMGQPVCRVCCSLETLLMRWDTCQDLDDGQNLTTTSKKKI